MLFFGLKPNFKKNLFLFPNPSSVRKLGQNGLKTVVYRGGLNRNPFAGAFKFRVIFACKRSMEIGLMLGVDFGMWFHCFDFTLI